MMFSSWPLAAAVLATTAHAKTLTPIAATGNKFFDAKGDQFFIKGIAYQLIEEDPLIDTEQCQRDAALMQTLGTNAIRVYHVDPKADHDGCMAVFDRAGIYALIDMDTFDSYILPDHPQWNKTQYDRYGEVLDAFIKYDNVLGFFVGNEIISKATHSGAAPYIKAAARDMKAYRDARGYRKVPIGYSAADIAELRPMLQDYLTCGSNHQDSIDFFGLNSYQWCDPSSYTTSGYASLQNQAKNFPVPIFFSETGCNQPGPRLFEDQSSIFGPEMSKDWSGAIIYEWIQEANHYGLISYGPKVEATVTVSGVRGGFTRAGTPIPVSPDFDNLRIQWQNAKPTHMASADYDAKHVSTRECPKSTQGGWLVDGNVKLPPPAAFPPPAATMIPSSSDGSKDSDEEENPAPPTMEIAHMSAALVAVMLIFAVWF